MKLKKRLPESRSQKRERLAADRDRHAMDRHQMLERREAWLAQQDQGRILYHAWRHAVANRLTSEDAYARFEEIHTRYWDFFRHVGLPNTALSLALQHHRDGRPVDPEPLVAALEERLTRRLLRLTRQLARAGRLSADQEERLRGVVLATVDFPRWHREFGELVRLARALSTPAFRAALERRLPDPRAAAVLVHLDQEDRMQQRP